MRDNTQVQDTVCSTLGPLLSLSSKTQTLNQPSSSPATNDDKKKHVVMTIEALSLSLKAFIALQTATGTLTEETIHHVQAVQEEVFDVIARSPNDEEEEEDEVIQKNNKKGNSGLTLTNKHVVTEKNDSVDVDEKEEVVSPTSKRKIFSWANLKG
jgi:hypothetical protein